MRAGVLSQPRVIAMIRERFTPFALNVTVDKFESAKILTGLRHLEGPYSRNWRFEFGFASCSVLNTTGEHLLNFSGAAGSKRSPADPFGEEAFLEFLQSSLQRNETLTAAQRKLASGQWQEGMADIQRLIQQVLESFTKAAAQVKPEDMSAFAN